ncbi:MAG: STAS domain-containing protein [Pseudomonadota bacterium]
MTDLVIDEETTGPVTVLAPAGRVDTSTAKTFETAALSRIEAGGRAMVFDFGKLDYISSAGLRVVLLAGKRIRAAGGALILCNMNAAIRDVFEISGFLALFTVKDSRAAAISEATTVG